MLEKPDLQDETLICSLQAEYSLPVIQVSFLSVGADRHTAAYRAVTEDGKQYFAKLRRGAFDQTSVVLLKFLSDQEIAQIIAPLATKAGHLWASLDSYRLIVYPYIEGGSGYEVDLSDRHWGDLGRALKAIHTLEVPRALRRHIPRETYSGRWRDTVRAYLPGVDGGAPADSVTACLASLLQARHHQIADLVERAEDLAQELQTRSPEFVLCHADLHAGNVLIEAGGPLYVVDWDDPIFAPKERDLMFIGAGHFGHGRTAQEEETLFYQGYGPTQVDPPALAYYRYERIVQDIAVFCERIVSEDEGRGNREQCFRYLASHFRPSGTIDSDYQSDRTQDSEKGLDGTPPLSPYNSLEPTP
jgi:spectinomycin phosphotransferase